LSSEFGIISIFSHLSSSITAFTLIHFCQIRVQTGSISSKFEETRIFVFIQACLTIASILINHSSISGTFSLKIALTSSAFFLVKTTFETQASFLETSSTYR